MLGDQRTPTRNVSHAVTPEWIGRVHHFGIVASTMDEARRLAMAGAPHGTAAVARQQLGGRGRSGRAWVSPPGNLHLTAVLRSGHLATAGAAPQLGFVTALAVAAAVDALAGPPTALKWPNDVMRGGAKLAGILMERLDDGTVLAGIGLNVGHAPPGMAYPATCLRTLGCEADVPVALAAVLEALRSEWGLWRTGGFGPVLDRWGARGPAPGTTLQVSTGAALVGGTFAGLRADGALLMDVGGERRAFVAGDVQPCVPAPTCPKRPNAEAPDHPLP